MATVADEGRSVPRRLFPLLIIVVVFGALALTQLRNSEQGIGEQKPVISVDFPATAEAGSIQTAVVHVENPAASDIESLFVSFSALAVGGGEEFPTPIVAGRVAGSPPAVVDIEPEPTAREQGVRFAFGPLGAGESTTIRFDLRMPETTGSAANSIAIYDGTTPERSSGDSIEVTIEE